MEVWKDIIGFEGLYQVSNLGTVKSLRKGLRGNKFLLRDKKLIGCHDKDGYLKVNFYKDNKMKRFSIHRLVCIAFLPNIENKPFVNHINGIKTDNSIENLEWCTQSENEKHAWNMGLKNQNGVKNPMNKLTEMQILEIRSNLHNGKTQKEIAEIYNINQISVSEIRLRKTWKHI